MSDHLKKVENELLPEIEIAALKGNMNRVIVALRSSLTELVEHAKLAEQAFATLNELQLNKNPSTDGSSTSGVDEAKQVAIKVNKTPARKPAKKAPAKKTEE